MKLIPVAQFHKLLRGYGLEPQPSADDCRYLTLKGHHESRFWNTPKETTRASGLMKTLLQGCDPCHELLLWPRGGFWPHACAQDERTEVIAAAIMRYAGFPESAEGAALFTSAEIPHVIAILFAHAAFGWNVQDDVYVIPDHAQQILQLDHHDVVHVHCRSHRRMQSFIDHMDGCTFPLPTELPDQTFKPVSWMRGESNHET